MFAKRDLFGNPVDPGHGKRGRPRHMPSEITRKLVTEARAAGLSQITIAQALGITIPTLLRNYHTELGSTSQLWRRREASNERK